MQDRTLGAASALVELVVRGTRAGLRDRVLLDVALELSCASSGAVWRRSAASWRAAATRGPRAALPDDATLEACLGAGTSAPGCGIARVDAHDRGLAIVLGAGELRGDGDSALDEIEALLAAVLVLESASGLVAGPPGPIPSRLGSRPAHHDLRNALTSLLATEQVLTRFGADLPPSERERFEGAIDRECRRAGALIAGELQCTARPVPDPAPAAQIAADVVALERLARHPTGAIVLEVAPEAEGAFLRLDPQAWSRIVRNLVVNALEASDPGGAIHLDLGIETGERADEACIRLRVEDRGRGLPPLELAQVLRPGVSWGKPEGTGQGLAVVADLVRAGGGTLVVERLARGSRFEVSVPVSCPPPGTGASEKKS